MKDLILTATATSPFIHFKSTGRLEITGKMISDDQSTFWNLITDWIEMYKNQLPNHIDVFLQIDYLNTASLKQLNSFLLILANLRSESQNVDVIWLYNQADIYMKEIGVELSKRCCISFKMNRIKEFV